MGYLHFLEVFFLNMGCLRGFPGGTSGKEPSCQCRKLKRRGSNPGLERFPQEGIGNPLQYSCLKNPMDRRNPAGYSPWGHKESDTTEVT